MSTVKPFPLSVPWYVRRNVPQGIWTQDDGQETPQGMICSRDKTKSISVKPSVCLFLKSCNLFKTKRLRCLGVVAIKLLHTALLEFAAVQQDWTTKWGNVRLLQQVLIQMSQLSRVQLPRSDRKGNLYITKLSFVACWISLDFDSK